MPDLTTKASLTAEECAELLDIDVRTVRNKARAGKLHLLTEDPFRVANPVLFARVTVSAADRQAIVADVLAGIRRLFGGLA